MATVGDHTQRRPQAARVLDAFLMRLEQLFGRVPAEETIDHWSGMPCMEKEKIETAAKAPDPTAGITFLIESHQAGRTVTAQQLADAIGEPNRPALYAAKRYSTVREMANKLFNLFDKENKVLVHLGYDPDWTKQVLDGFKIRTQPDRWPAGKFVHPHDACFDKDGNIYVAEWVATGRVSFLRHVS